MIRSQEDARLGALRSVSQPLRFDGQRTALRLPPPAHGADGQAVLLAAGFSADEIASLAAAGAVRLQP